jgi:hypothetical protein
MGTGRQPAAMKLLLENWREFLVNERQCKAVIAYHSSNNKFDKFDMGFASPEDHAGKGLFFASHPFAVLEEGKYIYKVKLNLCKGVRYPEEPDSTIHNYGYDFAHYSVPASEAINYEEEDDVYTDEWDDVGEWDEWSHLREIKVTIYRMLNEEDIEILEVEER